MNRNSLFKINLLICINILMISVGAFIVYHGNFWTDENWYYQGSVLFSKYYFPYIDFFYHRLPLHVEFYGLLFKIFGASFITGRFISLALFIVLVNLSAIVVYKICNDFKFAILNYLIFLNPTAFHGFLTNSTYSLNALLLVLSAYILLAHISRNVKLFLFVIVNFLIYSNRYLIDYQAVFIACLLVSLVVYFRKDVPALVVVFASSLAGILYILKYSIFHSVKYIIFDTVTFNLTSSVALIKNGVQKPLHIMDKLKLFGELRFLEFDSFYPVNIICFIAIGALVIQLYKTGHLNREIISSNRLTSLCYISLIVVLNYLFYYQTVTDFPVTKVYIVPFMGILSTWIMNEMSKSYMGTTFAPKGTPFLLFVVLFLTHGIASNQEFVKMHYRQSDMAKLEEVSYAIKKLAQNRGETILTFTPALTNSETINEPRLNMEMYAFRPDLTNEQIENYKLMNSELLIDKIRKRDYSVIALSQDRFFGENNMSKVIVPYRESIMNVIQENYKLVETINSEGFQGNFYLYVPQNN